MVQNFEAYGVEITVEKPIAVCVACSFCVNIDMAVDKNVTHFCEILGKEMTNQEADNKPCSECPITYRNKESLNEKKEKGKMLIISIVILFMGLVYMGAIGVETFSRSLIFIMISIVELFLIVYADRKDFEEKRNREFHAIEKKIDALTVLAQKMDTERTQLHLEPDEGEESLPYENMDDLFDCVNEISDQEAEDLAKQLLTSDCGNEQNKSCMDARDSRMIT